LIPFLNAVKENNNVKRMHSNIELYQMERGKFADFVWKILNELKSLNPDFEWINAKDCLFRFNKDIRFGKDKSPYKNNFAAVFSMDWKKSPWAKFYVSIEPDWKSFVWWGLYYPELVVLNSVRKHISKNLKSYEKIISEKKFVKAFWQIQWERLKKIPAKFEKDDPAENYIRMKARYVWANFSDEEILKPSFYEKIIELYKIMSSFLEFLNEGAGR
jgi:uncharacterized protein (TIGR02453 family)